MDLATDPAPISNQPKLPRSRPAAYWLVGVVLTVVFVAACSIGPVETVVREDSFSVGASPRVEVISENGRISVRSGGAGSTIQVTATIKNPDRVSYSARQEGHTVLVVAEVNDTFSLFGGGGGATIEVVVPARVELSLETSNGGVSVTGVNGPVSARTSNGGIHIDEVDGDLDVRTSNGGIDIGRVSGQVRAVTSNGGVELAAAFPPGSQNRVQTSNGGVTVTLLEDTGVNLQATTSNGSVKSSLPITTTTSQERTRLQGTIGAGGAELEIHTSNGNITIQ